MPFHEFAVIANTVLTESEKAFRIVQIKRSGKTIDNHLKETYGERINKFNRKLAKLPQRKLLHGLFNAINRFRYS